MLSKEPRHPNIIWLTLDHVTFHHYQHMTGARPILKTYEKLCQNGTEFTNCKSVHPLCMPARASMLTGVYTHKHGKYNNKEGQGSKHTPLIMEYLERSDYRMGYFGKNHSGFENLNEYDIDYINFSSYGPEENPIYDEYGNAYMSKEYRQFISRKGIDSVTYHQEWGADLFRGLPNKEYNLLEVDTQNAFSCGMLTPENVHEIDFLVDLAKNWIEKRHNKPFVLRLDTWAPHPAYIVPAEFANKHLKPEEIELPPEFYKEISVHKTFSRDYMEKISNHLNLDSEESWKHVLMRAYEQYSYIDMRLGEFIEWLEQTGLRQSTIILLTADHGDAIASKGGMFDKCGDMQEEVMEIPMVVDIPWIQGGKPNDSLVSNLDVVPTVLDLLNIPVPAHMDGMSLKAMIENRIPGRKALMCEHYGHMFYDVLQRTLYYKGFKYIVTTGYEEQLFHIDKDPFELHDLAKDPLYTQILQEMKEQLYVERQRYNDISPD